MLKKITGILLILVGLAALFAFGYIKEYARGLSPDGVIDAHSFLQFQICLSSLLIVGLYLLLEKYFYILFRSVMHWLDELPQRNLLLYFLGGGFLLRLLVQIILPMRLWADSQGYHDLAVNWLTMGGYYDGVYPTATWPPGYPFLLSRIYWLFGFEPQVGIFVNILLNLGICFFAYKIVQRFADEIIARLTLVIIILFPSQILFINLLMSENLFTFLFLLSIYFFLSPRPGAFQNILGGIILGLATLTRALTLTFIPFLIPSWKKMSGSWGITLRNFILATIGLSLIVIPWIIRNQDMVGVKSVSSNGGVNLYLGNNPGAGMGWIPPDPNVFVLHDPAYEAYNDSVGFDLGSKFIRDHPGTFIKRGILKVAFMFAIDVDPLHYDLIRTADRGEFNGYVFLAYLTQYYYILILFLCLLGIITTIIRYKEYLNYGSMLFLIILLYWSAVHFVFFGFGRFHFPVIAMLSFFASLYLVHRVSTINLSKRKLNIQTGNKG